MPTQRVSARTNAAARRNLPWLAPEDRERELLEAAAVRRTDARTLREIAGLAPVAPSAHRMPPSALRVRPCKGPNILYCLGHRELFDIWLFWDPEALGPVREDALTRLDAHLRWFEPERGASGAARDARLIELVTAFLARHEGCAVRVCLDSSAEYAEVIGSGEEAWTVFCLSEDDPLWEQVCLAHVERCRREVDRFKREKHVRHESWEERVQWKKDREMWTRHLQAAEKELRERGTLWPEGPHVGDVLEQLRSVPLSRPLVSSVP